MISCWIPLSYSLHIKLYKYIARSASLPSGLNNDTLQAGSYLKNKKCQSNLGRDSIFGMYYGATYIFWERESLFSKY